MAKKRSKLQSYVSKVMLGNIYPRQLLNLACSHLLSKTQIIPWQPTHISIFATDRCNFSCDMCPAHSTKIPRSYTYRHQAAPDASLNLFLAILARFPNTIRLSLIGTGEPLFNPHFFDMVREGNKRRMIVDTISNGYALEEYINELSESQIDRICVSLNGHNSDEFHRMTGNPRKSYDRILENIYKLLRVRAKKNNNKLRVELSFIIDKYNYRHMGEMIAIGESLGVEAVALRQFQASPYPNFTPEERCLYADDPGVCEEFKQLFSRQYRCEVSWPYLLRRNSAKRVVCRWPWTTIQVDGDGNVGGCPMQALNMHENGRIYDEDPWNNRYFRDLRRRHLEGDLFGPCQSCVESYGIDPRKIFSETF
jgi:MoaA/NifB/PqqE/SkfB family radical SAM enzyme